MRCKLPLFHVFHFETSKFWYFLNFIQTCGDIFVFRLLLKFWCAKTYYENQILKNVFQYIEFLKLLNSIKYERICCLKLTAQIMSSSKYLNLTLKHLL